jgi:hypothetical protein
MFAIGTVLQVVTARFGAFWPKDHRSCQEAWCSYPGRSALVQIWLNSIYQEIPLSVYVVVAEILAFAYSMNNRWAELKGRKSRQTFPLSCPFLPFVQSVEQGSFNRMRPESEKVLMAVHPAHAGRTGLRFDIGLDTQSEEEWLPMSTSFFPSQGWHIPCRRLFQLRRIDHEHRSRSLPKERFGSRKAYLTSSRTITNVQTVGKRDVLSFIPSWPARDRAQPILSEEEDLVPSRSIQKPEQPRLAIDGEGFLR